jgi:hypothetical protein
MNLRPIIAVTSEHVSTPLPSATRFPKDATPDTLTNDMYQEIETGPTTILGEDGAFWKSYLKEAKAFDKHLLAEWNDSLDSTERLVSLQIVLGLDHLTYARLLFEHAGWPRFHHLCYLCLHVILPDPCFGFKPRIASPCLNNCL